MFQPSTASFQELLWTVQDDSVRYISEGCLKRESAIKLAWSDTQIINQGHFRWIKDAPCSSYSFLDIHSC